MTIAYGTRFVSWIILFGLWMVVHCKNLDQSDSSSRSSLSLYFSGFTFVFENQFPIPSNFYFQQLFSTIIIINYCPYLIQGRSQLPFRPCDLGCFCASLVLAFISDTIFFPSIQCLKGLSSRKQAQDQEHLISQVRYNTESHTRARVIERFDKSMTCLEYMWPKYLLIKLQFASRFNMRYIMVTLII